MLPIIPFFFSFKIILNYLGPEHTILGMLGQVSGIIPFSLWFSSHYSFFAQKGIINEKRNNKRNFKKISEKLLKKNQPY